MELRKVKTSIGTFTIKRPSAGVRNDALIASESNTGHVKLTTFMVKLLPYCIQERPEGCDKDVPINDLLRSLSCEDYDTLHSAISDFVETSIDKEAEKKMSTESSKDSLKQENIPKT